MTKDVEHCIKCLSAILDSSVDSSLFRSVLHSFVGLFVHFLSSLYILDIRPLSDVGLVKIFSYSVSCHFALLTMSFVLQSFSVSGDHIYYFFLCQCLCCWGYI